MAWTNFAITIGEIVMNGTKQRNNTKKARRLDASKLF